MNKQQSYVGVKPPPPPEYAEKLYPDNKYLQEEWLRAISVVRSTSRGWLLDNGVLRRQAR